MKATLAVRIATCLLWSLPLATVAQTLPQRINDSGLLKCFAGAGDDTITQIPCSNPDWPGQDGASGRDAAAAGGTLVKLGAGDGGFDFTKISNGGDELPASAQAGSGPGAWACTRDNVTGLVWRITVVSDRAWAQARGLAVDANAAATCGRNDWRLPTTDELLGIVDFRVSGPAIDGDYFPATASAFHWTADRRSEAGEARARIVNAGSGFVHALDATRAAGVRLVAGGGDFGALVDNGDGTVTDPRTGLMWDRCAIGQATAACSGTPTLHAWRDALLAAAAKNAQNWHGHADWRLPNVKELATLLRTTPQRPAIDAAAFPNTPASAHWSSTSYVHVTRMAWAVFFGDGDVFAKNKSTRAYVRLVRTATAAASGTAPDAVFADDFDLAAVSPVAPADVLPLLSLTTDGGAAIDHDIYVAGALAIAAVDAGENYQGTLQVKGHGNSTWDMPKKPYRIKLDVKAPLLGMPSDKNWLLLANYSDKTLLRNLVAMTLGERLGMAWSPRSRMVELALNGQYQGVYQLMENIRVDHNRVDIEEMEPGDVAPPEVTGGYLFELDMRRDCAANVQFDTSRGVPFCIDTPDDEDIVPAQYDYLRGYVQQTEDAIWSGGFTDPVTGYRAWLDPASFIDWYIVNELVANVDSANFSSIWNYKDRDGLLMRGPLWDFDLSTGNAYYGTCADPQGFWVHEGTWYQRLFDDPWFASQVRQRWTAVKAGALDTLPDLIDEHAAELGAAASANFQKWPILDAWVWPNVVVTGSHEGDLAYAKDWLRQRIDWLDANL